MPRIRTVKPAYPKSKKVRSVSRDARLLNIHLWNLADDEGRLQELVQWILGEVFPTDEDVTRDVLDGWLAELDEAGLIRRYEVDGERYIQIHDWTDHQRIEKAKASDLPPPPRPLRLVSDNSGSDPGGVPEESRPEEEEEGKRKGSSNSAPAQEPGEFSEIVRALDAVAFARGAPSPKVPAVLTACTEYAQHDLAAEVAKFAHYWTEGPGEKRSLNDVAWSWRGWLEKVRDKPPGRQGKGGSARSNLEADLEALEAAHAQAVREEKADEAAA